MLHFVFCLELAINIGHIEFLRTFLMSRTTCKPLFFNIYPKPVCYYEKNYFFLAALLLSTFANAQIFYGATGPITDNNCDATHNFPVTVSGVGVLGGNHIFGELSFDITHSYDADLYISLIAPDGTSVAISSGRGGSGDNFTNTIISPSALVGLGASSAPFNGTFLPDGNLIVFNGLNADGVWTLRVCDDAIGDVGTVNSWSLTLSTSEVADYADISAPTTYINQAGAATIYAQVFKSGQTDTNTQEVQGIQGWIGYSTTNSNPNTWSTWVPATFNQNVGPNDEYKASLGSSLPQGTYYYASRFRVNGGSPMYGGTSGFWNGTTQVNGILTVGPPVVPANDNCAFAMPLTVNPDYLCGITTSGTVLAATTSLVDGNSCSGAEDDDVWFSFIATAATHRVSLLNVVGSATDLNHSLWTGPDCNALTLVPGTCSDPNVSNPTGLVVGQTYYLRVYSATSIPMQTTIFNICIGSPPTPPTTVTLQSPASATIAAGDAINVFGQIYKTGMTDSVSGQTPGIQAWVGFSPTNTDPSTWTNWVVATFNQKVGDSDEYKAIIGSTLTPGTYYFATRFQLTGGSFFYGGIDTNSLGGFWDGVTFNSGVLTVNMPVVPTNDICSGAIPLSVGTGFSDFPVTGVTYGATDSAATTITCDGTPLQVNSNVYYSVVVPESGALGIETRFSLSNSLSDTVMVISAGTCGAPIGLSCSDNNIAGGLFSKVTLYGYTPGTVLYVAVYKKGTVAPSVVASQFRIAAYYNSNLETKPFESDQFLYYPNPVSDFLQLTNDTDITKVEIFNMMQQKVYSNSAAAKEMKINLADIARGLYIVYVTSSHQTKTFKIIKQ